MQIFSYKTFSLVSCCATPMRYFLPFHYISIQLICSLIVDNWVLTFFYMSATPWMPLGFQDSVSMPNIADIIMLIKILVCLAHRNLIPLKFLRSLAASTLNCIRVVFNYMGNWPLSHSFPSLRRSSMIFFLTFRKSSSRFPVRIPIPIPIPDPIRDPKLCLELFLVGDVRKNLGLALVEHLLIPELEVFGAAEGLVAAVVQAWKGLELSPGLGPLVLRNRPRFTVTRGFPDLE